MEIDMQDIERRLPAVLIEVSLLVSGVTVWIATQRTLTGLEGALQAFGLVAGLVGSFIFGWYSAKDAARR